MKRYQVVILLLAMLSSKKSLHLYFIFHLFIHLNSFIRYEHW